VAPVLTLAALRAACTRVALLVIPAVLLWVAMVARLRLGLSLGIPRRRVVMKCTPLTVAWFARVPMVHAQISTMLTVAWTFTTD